MEIEKIHYVFRILEAIWGYEFEYLNFSNKQKETEGEVFALSQLVYSVGERKEEDLIFSFNKVIYMFLDNNVEKYTEEEIENIYPVYLDDIATSAFSEI
jgi:hypothetical protein